jgi:hypothetical protein
MGLLHGRALVIARGLHGPSSVIWLILLALHVLVYLGRAWRRSISDALPTTHTRVRGRSARAYALATVVISGLVLGAATIPAQHRWIDLRRHHRRENATPVIAVRPGPRGRCSLATVMVCPGERRTGDRVQSSVHHQKEG